MVRARSISAAAGSRADLAGYLVVVDVPGDVLGDVADRLDAQAEACRPDAEYFVNPAKTLALDLSSRVPVVLGDGPVTGVAARRASTMLARTARTPSTWGRLPDAAAQVLACLSGPFTGAASAPDGGRDVFADPYIDGPAGPELGLLLLRRERVFARAGSAPDGSGTVLTIASLARGGGDSGPRFTELSDELRGALTSVSRPRSIWLRSRE